MPLLTIAIDGWASSSRSAGCGTERRISMTASVIALIVSTSGKSSFRTRSEEHTSELQSLMRTSYAVFCLKKKIITKTNSAIYHTHKTRQTQQQQNKNHT